MSVTFLCAIVRNSRYYYEMLDVEQTLGRASSTSVVHACIKWWYSLWHLECTLLTMSCAKCLYNNREMKIGVQLQIDKNHIVFVP